MVTRTKSRMGICIAVLVAWLAVIWGNSMTPGQVSGQLSGWASEVIGKLLPFLSPESEHGHLLVRKIAHFSEFALLGLILRWLFAMVTEKNAFRFLLPLGCGMMAAVMDECIQIFSPGRVCSFWDMCIDWSGVLTGIGFMTLFLFFLQKRKKSAV